MTRQMKLIAFLQAQNCSNYPASWRHPSSMGDWGTRQYYERIGRILEELTADYNRPGRGLTIREVAGPALREVAGQGDRAGPDVS